MYEDMLGKSISGDSNSHFMFLGHQVLNIFQTKLFRSHIFSNLCTIPLTASYNFFPRGIHVWFLAFLYRHCLIYVLFFTWNNELVLMSSVICVMLDIFSSILCLSSQLKTLICTVIIATYCRMYCFFLDAVQAQTQTHSGTFNIIVDVS